MKNSLLIRMNYFYSSSLLLGTASVRWSLSNNRIDTIPVRNDIHLNKMFFMQLLQDTLVHNKRLIDISEKIITITFPAEGTVFTFFSTGSPLTIHFVFIGLKNVVVYPFFVHSDETTEVLLIPLSHLQTNLGKRHEPRLLVNPLSPISSLLCSYSQSENLKSLMNRSS